MVCSNDQSSPGGAWGLASRQHGVVSARQLARTGLSRRAVQHRVARGRLHRVMRGVYAVGRPGLTRKGHWMAAVLSCGPGAVLSRGAPVRCGGSAPIPNALIEVSLMGADSAAGRASASTVVLGLGSNDLEVRDAIPVTAPILTLIDLAGDISPAALERAVNEADRLGLVDPEGLRESLESHRGQGGVGKLRTLLDSHTFRLTDSELEARFLAIVRQAGSPVAQDPPTRERVPRRLLLADARARRRDRWSPLSPHTRPTGAGSHPRPGAYRGRHDPAAVHARAGAIRDSLRPRDPHDGDLPAPGSRPGVRSAAPGIIPLWT